MSLAEHLRAANLAYRDPALYDDMLWGDRSADAVADAVRHVLGPGKRPSALDLGCGTGRVASILNNAHGWSVVGIDVQPALITYARDHYGSDISWIVADIRTFVLGRDFDVLVSVGNTLSYLHTEDELDSFFRAAYAHSHPGTVLVLATLDVPPSRPDRQETSSSDVHTRYGMAIVDLCTVWDPTRHLLTTHRTWTFSENQKATDVMVRRIWTPAAISSHANRAGFTALGHPTPEGLSLVAVRT